MKTKSISFILIFISKLAISQVWNGSGVTGVAHREEEVIIGGTSGSVIGSFLLPSCNFNRTMVPQFQ